VGHWWSTCFEANVSDKLDHPSPSESPKTVLVQIHPSQNLIPHPKIYVSPKTAVCPLSIRNYSINDIGESGFRNAEILDSIEKGNG
jgi:hypothetical protein